MADPKPVPWAAKRESEFGTTAPPMPLKSESFSYLNIHCTGCPYRNICPSNDLDDHGCRMRRSIYEDLFAKIEFKTDDPLTINRLRLVTYYSTELQLLRNFGIEISAEEVNLLKTTLQEFGKLFIDKKGDLMDAKSRTSVPWDQDPELQKLKKELEEARAQRAEYEQLKAEAEKRKKEKKDGEPDSPVREQ